MLSHRPIALACVLAGGIGALLCGCSSTGASTVSGSIGARNPSAVSTALDVTTLNGSALPVPMVPMTKVTTMLDTIDADGNRLVITQGTRPAHTRAAIHIHKYGGHTCVLSGEITDYMDGQPPMTFPAGTCYYMPPNTLMTATNLGSVDAVLIDTFTLPVGQPTITIREPGGLTD